MLDGKRPSRAFGLYQLLPTSIQGFETKYKSFIQQSSFRDTIRHSKEVMTLFAGASYAAAKQLVLSSWNSLPERLCMEW
jgi:hypothetical protein